MATCIAAFDGGGSSTRCAIADASGRVLALGVGGPIIDIRAPNGPEQCRQSVLDALEDALSQSSLSVDRISLAACGMTCALPPVESVVREALMPIPKTVVVHDTVTALMGSLAGAPGVVVISGTGSVAFGRNQEGRSCRVGGWGYVMGDEGSGYWIGLRALSLATRAHDGVIPPTTLVHRVPKHFGCDRLIDIHPAANTGGLAKHAIASLARTVCDAAMSGDEASIQLLREAGAALGELVVAVARRLSLQAPLFSYAGGVFRAGPLILAPFRERVTAACPGATLVHPVLDGVGGAILIGLKEAGIVVDEAVVERVRVSLAT